MNPFFVDENYYYSIEDYMHDVELEEKEQVDTLADNWEQEIELAELEKIITIDESSVDDMIEHLVEYLIDRNVERFPEDSDTTEEKIKKAVKASIDIKKLNELMPELWYPNDKTDKLTKQDLLDNL